LPFNIVGVSPTYKNLTLHAGHRSMSFSKYSLSGHSFLGGGAEYKKNKWAFAAMGERLLKGVEYDSTSSPVPIYKRMEYGFKVAYSNKGDEIKFISFYAKDVESSIRAFPVQTVTRPLENQVYSISLKKKLNKKITLRFEGAQSGVTKDKRNAVLADNVGAIRQRIYFIPIKTTTTFSSAFNAGLDLSLGKAKVGAGIERVESDYRTLGAYFINSDFQNVTLSFSRPLLKKKISFSSRLGLQKDDLQKTKLSSMKRVVFSTNMGVTVSKKVKLNLSYSNFNSFINIKPVDQAFAQNSDLRNIDTLNFTQINQSYTASVAYKMLDNTNLSHNLGFNANYNLSDSKAPEGNTVNSVATAGVNYSLRLKKSKTSIGASVNANQNQSALGEAFFVEGGVNASRKILKEKISATLSANVMNNYENSKLTARLFSINNSYSLKLGKKHSINIGLRISSRVSIAKAELSYYKTSFQELFVNAGYSYQF